MSTPALKPCPFCGGRAVYERAESSPQVGMSFDPWLVRCSRYSSCGALGPVGGPFPEGKREAAEKWNRRAQ